MKLIIEDAGKVGIVGKTSEAQKKKVEGLAAAQKMRVKREKIGRKEIKGGRRDRGD